MVASGPGLEKEGGLVDEPFLAASCDGGDDFFCLLCKKFKSCLVRFGDILERQSGFHRTMKTVGYPCWTQRHVLVHEQEVQVVARKQVLAVQCTRAVIISVQRYCMGSTIGLNTVHTTLASQNLIVLLLGLHGRVIQWAISILGQYYSKTVLGCKETRQYEMGVKKIVF